MIKTASKLGELPLQILHKIVFCSLIKAALLTYNASNMQRAEIEKIIKGIPASYRALINGKLYLSALKFVKSFNDLIKNAKEPFILKEANIHYILDFLKETVGKVGVIVVLDCGSIPELVTLTSRFASLNHHTTILNKAFINPKGVTAFLTEQLTAFNRKTFLRQYAQLLKETLNAKAYIKISTIDLVAHQQGVTIENFLASLNMLKIFDQINHFAKQDSVLITSDHGYDIIADEHGLYVTHGYKGECPLNLSKVALFAIID